jgi:hypothetical protein
MQHLLSIFASVLVIISSSVVAQSPGSFADGGDTEISAMMVSAILLAFTLSFKYSLLLYFSLSDVSW